MLSEFPAAIRKALYTTKVIESVNSVIRKFTRNRKQDPKGESALTADTARPRRHPPGDLAGVDLTAYVEPLTVGDPLPDAPLLLAPGWYVNVPLEATCQRSWKVLPQVIHDLVETPQASPV